MVVSRPASTILRCNSDRATYDLPAVKQSSTYCPLSFESCPQLQSPTAEHNGTCYASSMAES
eukprot:6325836-Pyramimonas_sp.AAC.1